MGHYIQGIVFRKDLVAEARRLIPGGTFASLPQDLRFMPVTDKVFDDLRLAYPQLIDSENGFERLSAPVEWVAIELSRGGAVAYVETEYHGGTGAQSSVVWKNGAVVLPARTADVGPINEALVLLGANRQDSHDEFDAVGLGQYRSNTDWFHKARRGAG
jgi:hypothetical protein